jgi:hypothetical protein
MTTESAIDVYLYRLTTMAALNALSGGTRKVTEEHVHAITSLSSRFKQSGGTVMAGDFYGYPHTSYSMMNGLGSGTGTAATVDFNNATVRSAISMNMIGGGAGTGTVAVAIKSKIKENLKLYRVTATRNALKMLEDTATIAVNAFLLAVSKGGPSPLRKKEFALFA